MWVTCIISLKGQIAKIDRVKNHYFTLKYTVSLNHKIVARFLPLVFLWQGISVTLICDLNHIIMRGCYVNKQSFVRIRF